MENRDRIGIFLLVIGVILYVYSSIVNFESNPAGETITKLICFIIGTVLIIGGILMLIIRKKKVSEKILDIQEKETEIKGYCKSCGAEILDKTGDFCSKCGSPLK
ncbi:MAG: hypothetical protein ACFE9T_15630 [Promethearchaeota archaeon]